MTRRTPHLFEALQQTMMACTQCELSATRSQVVVGEGNASASLMVVGEAPGAEEDRTGRPFVGRSGQLLDRLLLEVLGMSRAELFIANVVKCRPPENRNPSQLEVATCRPYLDEQIELIQPKVLLTLGNFSSRLLLDTSEGITRLRGRAYPLSTSYGSAIVVPTLHPAAVLRGGSTRLDMVKEDLALVAQHICEVAA